MKRALLWLLRAYQRYVSPQLPPACRYLPTCSEYACQAIQRFGVLRGGYLAGRRVLRCNPLFPGGYDPVPTQWPRRAAKH
ncbi:MAG: membrane protein insertion efficiency factor YidD [Eubacteriales bacterium]|nr:membrane protein insertion efficiency factor YidD [Eubacteriales bacterium]